MRRRRLLAALAASGGSLLSGCGDRVSEGVSAGASNRSPVATSPSTSESTTESANCPPVGTSVVCHRAALDDAPVVLIPSTESVSLAGESVGFTLHNRSDSELLFRPFDWQIWQRRDRWSRIDEDGDRPSLGETVLSPEGSYAWQVAVGPITVTADRPPVTVNDLDFEPGRYAFGVPARGNGSHTYVASFTVTD